MKIDLDALSEKELNALKANVEAALAKSEKKKMDEAKKAAEKAAKKFGFTLNDLVETSGAKKARAKKPSVAKYKNPSNPDQTWSGRGRQPGWIKEALAAGKALDQFAI
ncbi:MAG: H-NS histone family protein [Pseudomonadota bacterium]